MKPIPAASSPKKLPSSSSANSAELTFVLPVVPFGWFPPAPLIRISTGLRSRHDDQFTASL